MHPALYESLLNHHPDRPSALGRAAELLRDAHAQTTVVTASAEVVAVAELTRMAPLHLLGPALCTIRQEPPTLWVEFDQRGRRIGLLSNRHPANAGVVELCHVEQTPGKGTSLLRLGCTWLGLENAPEPDWRSILAAAAPGQGYPQDAEGDARWGRILDGILQAGPAFGETVEEEHVPAMISVLLFDLAVLAVLSGENARIASERWIGPDGVSRPISGQSGTA